MHNLKLNDSNIQNTTHKSNKIFWLNANAGSGKTTWIIKRIENLLRIESLLSSKQASAQNQVIPQNILCITFSKTAAKELNERIEAVQVKNGINADFEIAYTLHAFCFKLLKRHNPNYQLMPSSLETILWNQSVEEAFLSRELKDKNFSSTLNDDKAYNSKYWTQSLLDNIHLLYNQSVDQKVSKDVINGLPYHGELGELQSLAQQIFQHKKTVECLVSFEDILDHTIRLISSSVGGASVFEIMGQVEHLFIDEAQDLSAKQWEVVFALIQELTQHEAYNIYVVGDEKQSIYSFQGACVASYLHAKQMLQELAVYLSPAQSADANDDQENEGNLNAKKSIFEEIHLTRTYRCPKNVCALVDDIFADTFSQKHISEVKDGSIIMEDFANYDQMFEAVLEKLKHYAAEPVPRKILLLIRKRSECYKKLAEKIIQIGKEYNFSIEYNHLQKIKAFLSSFVKLLLEFNAYNLYCFLQTELMQPLCDNTSDGETCDNETYLERVFLSYSYDQENFIKPEYSLKKYFLPNGVNLYDAMNHCMNLVQGVDILEYLSAMQDIAHENTKTVNKERVQIGQDMILQAGQFFHSYPFSLLSLLDFIENYTPGPDVESKFDQNSDQNHKSQTNKNQTDLGKNNISVSIQTIHQTKGQEADVVFLFDSHLNPNMSPIDTVHNAQNSLLNTHPDYEMCKDYKRNANLQEHERLLYVALTRTKGDLIIYNLIDEDKKISESSWYHKISKK